ncbi:lipolytic protein G-D-S-L family [Faecalibacterium sp. CAG:1138]|nr:lipolytic protein G-D-S-L family [Faecalibacterium sp. CAG:1138]
MKAEEMIVTHDLLRITQGCFECYYTSETTLETVFDYNSAYSTHVREILNILYPSVQINIINSGISGDNAINGLTRIDRDVLSYHPDLVVVGFALNDSCVGESGLENYYSVGIKR